MSEIKFIDLGQMGTASNSAQAKEFNESYTYYWMKNKKGRVVPIAAHNLQWALKQGFSHTDGQAVMDNPADQVQAIHKSKDEMMANAMESMAAVMEAVADPEIVAEVKARKSRKKKVETPES